MVVLGLLEARVADKAGNFAIIVTDATMLRNLRGRLRIDNAEFWSDNDIWNRGIFERIAVAEID